LAVASSISNLNIRFIGDHRFTAGVGIQMLLKKGYTCSIATYGHLVEPDSDKPEEKQRQDTKEVVADHYNIEYYSHSEDMRQSEAPPERPLKDLVGTKRPLDKWEHKTYKHLFSFYAGKVYTFGDFANTSSRGRQGRLRLFPQHCLMMDILIFAFLMEM
jgi:hypothetical protein